jgi:formylglycine-generating enzyme required for sulfatase activity
MASSNDKPLRGQNTAQQANQPHVFHDTLKDGTPGPSMVWVPAGSFLMGDRRATGWENEGPIHKVSVSRFAIGIYPLTFFEYDRFAEATKRAKPHDQGWGRGTQPVINVSWIDAMAYCLWLSEQTGESYRLPTEAEWEYSARAGTETDYWWGNGIGRNNANCKGSDTPWSGEQTSPVDAFKANLFALHDTVGNVWEWTCSKYENQYQGEEQHFFEKANITVKRTIRGGSWHTPPNRTRVSARAGSNPEYRSYGRGFRITSRTSPQYGTYPGWMP